MTNLDIPWLVPDLPGATALEPWLKRIDANRIYSNHGPLVRELESALGAMIRAHHPTAPAVFVVLVSSGTMALELTARASGAAPGTRALVPAFTFPATALALEHAGFAVDIVDAGEADGVLPVPALDAVTSPCLVVPVAVFGRPIDPQPWDVWSQQTNCPVIIDAAAGFPAQRPGHQCHIVVSFHATKPFGIGEGGAVITTNATLAEEVRRLANFGFETGVVTKPGLNAKLGELQAASGLAQVHRWSTLAKTRAQVWAKMRAAIPAHRFWPPPYRATDLPPANLVIDCGPSDALTVQAHLAGDGITTRRLYAPGLHHHPWRQGRDQPCLATDRLVERLLCLPFHTRLADRDIQRIAQSVITATR